MSSSLRRLVLAAALLAISGSVSARVFTTDDLNGVVQEMVIAARSEIARCEFFSKTASAMSDCVDTAMKNHSLSWRTRHSDIEATEGQQAYFKQVYDLSLSADIQANPSLYHYTKAERIAQGGIDGAVKAIFQFIAFLIIALPIIAGRKFYRRYRDSMRYGLVE